MDRKWWKVFFKVLCSGTLWLSPHWLSVALIAASGCVGESILRMFGWALFLTGYTVLLTWMLTQQAISKALREELREELRQERDKLRLLRSQFVAEMMHEDPEPEPEPEEPKPSPWLLGEWQQHIKKK